MNVIVSCKIWIKNKSFGSIKKLNSTNENNKQEQLSVNLGLILAEKVEFSNFFVRVPFNGNQIRVLTNALVKDNEGFVCEPVGRKFGTGDNSLHATIRNKRQFVTRHWQVKYACSAALTSGGISERNIARESVIPVYSIVACYELSPVTNGRLLRNFASISFRFSGKILQQKMVTRLCYLAK